ncbi:hypothetical protein E5288_WYG012388 [Bos mutus]|uniref:Uncharacterized protein n=1 Tax=Bos mutus TaxID=72004 RepID=A0A6B0RSX1_9CETA|nr:hypothetical protein [Bos mutus]
MTPQSEPGEQSHNAQERMSPPQEQRVLGTCSGREAPRPEKGARTEQAETPCREDQVCAPRKPEPTGSCPGRSVDGSGDQHAGDFYTKGHGMKVKSDEVHVEGETAVDRLKSPTQCGAEALGRTPLQPVASHCLLNCNSRNAAILPWFDRAGGPHASTGWCKGWYLQSPQKRALKCHTGVYGRPPPDSCYGGPQAPGLFTGRRLPGLGPVG